jgi:PAS domain S-box-containing protein
VAGARNPVAVAAFERTQAVIDALPRAIVAADDAGLVLGWNRHAAQMFGWTAGEAEGHNVFELLRAQLHGSAPPDMQAAVFAGRDWSGRATVHHRDGSPVEVDASVSPLRDGDGRVVGMVGTVEDVDAQRRLELRAAQLAENLRLALAAGELGTWRWDMFAGTIDWDANLEALFGLPPGGFDGTFRTYQKLLHPDDRAHVLAEIDRAVATESGYEVDHRVIWPDGSVHWVHGRGSVTFDQRGRVSGTIGCVTDITRRKESEMRAEERAGEATRNAASERRQRERLEFLVGVTDLAMAARDHREFMDLVTAAAVPSLGDWCLLHFQPEPWRAPEVTVAHADPERMAWARKLIDRHPCDPNAEAGVAKVMRTGVTEFHPRVDDGAVVAAVARSRVDRQQAEAIVGALHLSSIITVPLQTKAGISGAVQFITAESERRYDENDLVLAQAVAGRLAEVLAAMWQVDQQRHIASTLQSALLPRALPAIPGLDVAVRYWAAGASEVGGDFYDLFPLDDRRWAVVIGDACGKGPSAAALTSIGRHTIRAAAAHGHDHATVLRWLNDAVLSSGHDVFCTVCYATIEPLDDGWRLVVSSGGHPLPVVVRADGSASTVGAPGTLIGAFPTIRVQPRSTTLAPGDTLVLITDGLTDVPPPHQLGSDALVELVAGAATATDAEGVAERLGLHIAEALPVQQRRDDIALVVLRAR